MLCCSVNCLEGDRAGQTNNFLTSPQPFHGDSSLCPAVEGETRICNQRDFSVGIPEDRAGPLFPLHPCEEEQDDQKDITIHPSTNYIDLISGKSQRRIQNHKLTMSSQSHNFIYSVLHITYIAFNKMQMTSIKSHL